MARSTFPGFTKDFAAFFRGLARNNHREWFLPRNPVFDEKVKEPMRQLVEALNAELCRKLPGVTWNFSQNIRDNVMEALSGIASVCSRIGNSSVISSPVFQDRENVR